MYNEFLINNPVWVSKSNSVEDLHMKRCKYFILSQTY